MFEIYEVFNNNNVRVFYTTDKDSVPNKREIETIIDSGHKIKVNNRILYKKKISDFLNELKQGEKNAKINKDKISR